MISRNQSDSLSRRAFLGAAAATGAPAVLARTSFATAADGAAAAATPAGKPNSVIKGLHIGCITYSYRDAHITTDEATRASLVKNGLSEVELMDTPIKAYTGIGTKAATGED